MAGGSGGFRGGSRWRQRRTALGDFAEEGEGGGGVRAARQRGARRVMREGGGSDGSPAGSIGAKDGDGAAAGVVGGEAAASVWGMGGEGRRRRNIYG